MLWKKFISRDSWRRMTQRMKLQRPVSRTTFSRKSREHLTNEFSFRCSGLEALSKSVSKKIQRASFQRFRLLRGKTYALLPLSRTSFTRNESRSFRPSASPRPKPIIFQPKMASIGAAEKFSKKNRFMQRGIKTILIPNFLAMNRFSCS